MVIFCRVSKFRFLLLGLPFCESLAFHIDLEGKLQSLPLLTFPGKKIRQHCNCFFKWYQFNIIDEQLFLTTKKVKFWLDCHSPFGAPG